jgi:hypothetical protein
MIFYINNHQKCSSNVGGKSLKKDETMFYNNHQKYSSNVGGKSSKKDETMLP